MKSIKVDVSIIVVNYRCWLDLERCLTSLQNISLKVNVFEVIVVDNLSQDGKLTEFSKKFPEFEFILNSGNNGFAQACNLGAHHANGTFLLFLNPDTIMPKNTLETLIEVAQNHSDYKIISCNKINEKGMYEKIDKPFPFFISLFGITRAIYNKFNRKISNKLTSKGNKIVFPSWVSGSLILMSKTWYEKTGGWNEDYWMYYEDVDLCKKTANMDGKIALIENINIKHNHGGSTRINLKTTALTKTEVIISRHVYINNNFPVTHKLIAQILLLFTVIISKFLLFIIGVLLYFIPKVRVNVFIFKNIIFYYLQALKNRTWLSPRSVNNRKSKKSKLIIYQDQ